MVGNHITLLTLMLPHPFELLKDVDLFHGDLAMEVRASYTEGILGHGS